MITITAIVYAVLLAPVTEVVGWSLLTDPILHQVTPIVTVLVWLVFGPRGWITGRTVLAAMVIPIAWIVWVMVRGSITSTYPYGFVTVSYTHLRAHETVLDLVCRLLLEKKIKTTPTQRT